MKITKLSFVGNKSAEINAMAAGCQDVLRRMCCLRIVALNTREEYTRFLLPGRTPPITKLNCAQRFAKLTPLKRNTKLTPK